MKGTVMEQRSGAWLAGWGIGALVVVIAASLLLTLIALGRRIIGQAEDITAALDGAREHTDGLYDVRETNAAIESITRSLRTVRTGAA